MFFVCKLSYSQGLDGEEFKIFGVKDTIIGQNFIGVYFKMTTEINTQNYNTGYTDLYFVDQSSDTLTIDGNWGYWLPSSTNIPNDTIEYVLAYKASISTFPTNFNGHLIAKNPDCEIPFNYTTMSIQPFFQENIQLNIFPNPTESEIQIKNNTKQPLTLIELYNLSGQLILTKTTDFDTIDLTDFDSGIYLLKVYTNDKQGVVKKIIKN